AEQENLAREIFQLWSNYLGVQFQEVSDPSLGAADFGIVTGVVQAVNPTAPASLPAIAGPAPTSPLTGFNGQPEYLAVMNAQTFATESLYGGPWFAAAIQQIGRLLGLGYDAEGAPGTVMGLGGADPATGAPAEPVFPGNADILHGQYIFRPQSDNVDMYQFTVNSAGTLDAETIAQRLTYDVIAMPPQSGPVGNSVVDGSTFTISDGTRTVTFEFAADVARAVNAAATATGLKASAIANGDQVDLNSGLTVTNSAAQGQVTYSQQ